MWLEASLVYIQEERDEQQKVRADAFLSTIVQLF